MRFVREINEYTVLIVMLRRGCGVKRVFYVEKATKFKLLKVDFIAVFVAEYFAVLKIFIRGKKSSRIHTGIA